jgi:cell division protein FtsW
MADGSQYTRPAGQAERLEKISGRYDGWTIFAALALACLGVVMVASSSIAVAEGHGVGPFHYLTRHLMFLAMGLGLAVMVMRTELKRVEAHAQLLPVACVAMLLLVYIPGLGHEVNGARRWINLGVSNFQVVEAVKIALIIWMASYLKRFSEAVQMTWSGMLKPLGIAGVMVLLLLLQPDFGSAMLICAVVGGMLLLGGANIPRMVAPVMLAIPAIGLLAVSESYRVRRLTSFMNPWEDPFKDGFQLTQALIAIGRGEWFGVGLGGSVQKLFYLPEAHTDFILAVIAEELGFVGVLAVIVLFALLTWRAFAIGLRAVEMRRLFSGLMAFGIGLYISLQAFVSIGVNLGLLPTKGLTLPLISSGGSSVLMTCVALALLLRVGYELDRAERQVARARGELAAEDGVPEAAAPRDTDADALRDRRGARTRGRVAPTLGASA